jgi:hypothetical protein
MKKKGNLSKDVKEKLKIYFEKLDKAKNVNTK